MVLEKALRRTRTFFDICYVIEVQRIANDLKLKMRRRYEWRKSTRHSTGIASCIMCLGGDSLQASLGYSRTEFYIGTETLHIPLLVGLL